MSARPVAGAEEITLAQKVVRTVVVACLAVVVGALAWTLRFLVTPVALAFLISYCLGPLVNALESGGVRRTFAVLLCFGVGVGVLLGLVSLLLPSLEVWLKQAPTHAGEKSVFELTLQNRLEDWEVAGVDMYPGVDWSAIFAKVQVLMEEARKNMMETLPAFVLGLLSNAGTLLLAPIIALFLLLDGAGMQKAVVAWVPNAYFETCLVLLHRVDRQIALYLRGAASESAIVMLLTLLMLWMVGMPNAVLFACIFGACNVVPIAGPVIGAGAGLLYSILEPAAPSMASLLGAYGVVYVLDAMVINPLVVGKNLNLHPLTVILGISVGGNLGGILGMLVIIPAIAVAKAIIGTVADGLRQRAIL